MLSSSGHILGIVNPPVKPPKRDYWVARAAARHGAEEWRERAPQARGQLVGRLDGLACAAVGRAAQSRADRQQGIPCARRRPGELCAGAMS